MSKLRRKSILNKLKKSPVKFTSFESLNKKLDYVNSYFATGKNKNNINEEFYGMTNPEDVLKSPLLRKKEEKISKDTGNGEENGEKVKVYKSVNREDLDKKRQAGLEKLSIQLKSIKRGKDKTEEEDEMLQNKGKEENEGTKLENFKPSLRSSFKTPKSIYRPPTPIESSRSPFSSGLRCPSQRVTRSFNLSPSYLLLGLFSLTGTFLIFNFDFILVFIFLVFVWIFASFLNYHFR